MGRNVRVWTIWLGAVLTIGDGANVLRGFATAATSTTLLTKALYPIHLHAMIDALGDRVVKPGNERAVSVGMITRGGKQTPFRMTREMPNKVLMEDLTSGKVRSVSFDGDSASASDQLADDDLDVTESVGDDSAEALLYSMQNGYTLRMLGSRFRTDRGDNPAYNGPWFDIFELLGAPVKRSATSARHKQVVFDSVSKLLLYVRYKVQRGGGVVDVQTEWSAWKKVNGYAVPGKVTRRENGTEVWNVQHDTVTILPAQADDAFKVKK